MSPYSKWKPWVAVSAVADSFNPGTPTGIPATQEPHGQNWSTDRSTSNPVPSRSKDHEAFLLLGIRDAPAAGVQAENAIKVHLRKAGLLWSDWRRPESSELGLELAIGFQRAIAWAVENEKSEVFVDFAEITFGAPNAALHAAYVTSGWGPTTTVGWRPFIPDLVRIQRAPFRYETARAAGRVRPQAAGGVRWRFEVIEVKWTSNLNVERPGDKIQVGIYTYFITFLLAKFSPLFKCDSLSIIVERGLKVGVWRYGGGCCCSAVCDKPECLFEDSRPVVVSEPTSGPFRSKGLSWNPFSEMEDKIRTAIFLRVPWSLEVQNWKAIEWHPRPGELPDLVPEPTSVPDKLLDLGKSSPYEALTRSRHQRPGFRMARGRTSQAF